MIIKIINRIKFLLKLFIFILVFPVIIFLIFILKFKKIRIIYLSTSRIGDFCLQTEYFIIEYYKDYKDKINNDKYIIISSKYLASNFFLYSEYIKKLKEINLLIVENRFLVSIFFFYKKLFNFIKLVKTLYTILIFKLKFPKKTYIFPLFNSTNPVLNFNNYNQDYITLLNRMGIDDINKKIVCIHIRDKGYLNKNFKKQNWTYHDFRNANINCYYKTINYLISLNYYVINIGYNEQIFDDNKIIDNTQFIDFQKTKFNNEKNQILLTCNSEFLIGTQSGISHVPQILNKPTLFVNVVPFVEKPFGKKNMFIHKKIFCLETNKFLSLNESFHKKIHLLYNFKNIKKNKLKYYENTEEEIHNSVIDFIYFLKNLNTYQPSLLQLKFNEILRKYNIDVLNDNLICDSFIKKNNYLLNDLKY